MRNSCLLSSNIWSSYSQQITIVLNLHYEMSICVGVLRIVAGGDVIKRHAPRAPFPANNFFTFIGFNEAEISSNSSDHVTRDVLVSHLLQALTTYSVRRRTLQRSAARCLALRCGAGSGVLARLSQNRKYITYCIVVREGPSHGTGNMYRKFRETRGFWATVCKTVRRMLSLRCPVCL